MLVLTRAEGDSVTVIDGTTGKKIGSVVFIRLDGNRIRLGLDFSSDYKLVRDELIEDENKKIDRISSTKQG